MQVDSKNSENDIPSFIYTSAHTRDMDKIIEMARDLQTIEWYDIDDRDPQNANIGGWEDLNEPIDEDIDEGPFVNEPDQMLISKDKRKKIRSHYHRSIMKKQKSPMIFKNNESEEKVIGTSFRESPPLLEKSGSGCARFDLTDWKKDI